MRAACRLAAASLVCLLAGCGPAAASAPAPRGGQGPLVRTPFGTALGVARPGADVWLGLPYAPAPVGPLRFEPPGAPPHWHGIRSATKAAPQCPVVGAGGGVQGSEDCLHLDVYRPTGDATGLPVAVFVHGGSFVAGDSSDYDPIRLADAGGLIVVVVDYRLGPLGFLAADGLDGPGATGGDAGLLDQVAALRWVNAAASSFGGDPRRVAVFGESAGGISVCDLVASPAAIGLFDSAIDESGPCTGPDATGPTLPEAAADGARYATAVGCAAGPGQPACLRRAGLATLLEGPPEIPGGLIPLPWRPAVGGAVLPDQPAGAIEARVAGPVPVLDGFDADDGATFVPSSVTTVAAFDRWVSSVFTGAAPAVERHYPVPAGAGRAVVRAVAAEVVTDAGFACPAVNLEQLLATRQPGRVWGYVFADPRATPAGDVHGSERGYLFGARGSPVPDGAAPLVAAMDAAWGAMLRSGDPSPAWPASTPSGSVVERLAPPAPSPEADEAVDHSCSFWSADGGGR